MRLKHAGFILLGQVYARNVKNVENRDNHEVIQSQKSKALPPPTNEDISKHHEQMIFSALPETPHDAESSIYFPTFTCWSDIKINYTLRCDCNNDCGDWEDEMNCPRKPKNSEFITCEGNDSFGPHRCIPKKWLCDGLDQCGNEWDESENACDIRKKYDSEKLFTILPEPAFAHVEASVKIPKTDPKITLWSDEKINNCNMETQFFCSNPGAEFTCVDETSVCDGENDCGNGDDESDELCQWKFVKFGYENSELLSYESFKEQNELECVARPGYAHEYWNLVYTTKSVYVSSGRSSDYYSQNSYGGLKKSASSVTAETTDLDVPRFRTVKTLAQAMNCVRRSTVRGYFNRVPSADKRCRYPSRLRCSNKYNQSDGRTRYGDVRVTSVKYYALDGAWTCIRNDEVCNGIDQCKYGDDEIEGPRCNKEKCENNNGKWCRSAFNNICTNDIKHCNPAFMTEQVCNSFSRFWCKVGGVNACISRLDLDTCDDFSKEMCESADLIYCKKPVLVMDRSDFESTVTPVQLLYDDPDAEISSGNGDLEEESILNGTGRFEEIPLDKLPNTHQCVHDYMQCHPDEINESVCKKELSGEFCKVVPGAIELKSDDRRNLENMEYSYSMFSASSAPTYTKLNLSEIAEAHGLMKENAYEICLPRFDGTEKIVVNSGSQPSYYTQKFNYDHCYIDDKTKCDSLPTHNWCVTIDTLGLPHFRFSSSTDSRSKPSYNTLRTMFSDITEYIAAELKLSEACVSGSTKFDTCCLAYGGRDHFEYYKLFVVPYQQRKSSTGDVWSRYTSGSRYRSRTVKNSETKKTVKANKSKIFIQLDVTDEVSISDNFSGQHPENADFEGEKAETETIDLNPETINKLKEIISRKSIHEWKNKISCDTRPVAPTMNKLCDLIKEFQGEKYFCTHQLQRAMMRKDYMRHRLFQSTFANFDHLTKTVSYDKKPSDKPESDEISPVLQEIMETIDSIALEDTGGLAGATTAEYVTDNSGVTDDPGMTESMSEVTPLPASTPWISTQMTGNGF